jgi:hypothetical protein
MLAGLPSKMTAILMTHASVNGHVDDSGIRRGRYPSAQPGRSRINVRAKM